MNPRTQQDMRDLKVAISILYLVSRFFSMSVEVFLRTNIGARAVSLLGFYLVAIAAMSAVIGLLLSGSFGFSPLLLALAVGFIAAGGFNQVQTLRRETLRGDYSVHSRSYGDSWTYPWFLRVWEKLPRHFTISEYTYQRFMEPTQVFLIGAAFVAIDFLFGGWLIAAGVFLLIREQIDHNLRWNQIRDAIDARIESEAMGRIMDGMANPEATGFEGHEPPLARALASTMKGQQLQSVAGMLANIDPALRGLKVTRYSEQPDAEQTRQLPGGFEPA